MIILAYYPALKKIVYPRSVVERILALRIVTGSTVGQGPSRCGGPVGEAEEAGLVLGCGR